MNIKRHRIQIAMKLRLAQDAEFWYTRATNLARRVTDGQVLSLSWFSFHRLCAIFGSDFGNTTLIEVVFDKSIWTQNQICDWFADYSVRYYVVSESQHNLIPPISEIVWLNDNELLAITKNSYNEGNLYTLEHYFEECTWSVHKRFNERLELCEERQSQILSVFGLEQNLVVG